MINLKQASKQRGSIIFSIIALNSTDISKDIRTQSIRSMLISFTTLPIIAFMYKGRKHFLFNQIGELNQSYEDPIIEKLNYFQDE